MKKPLFEFTVLLAQYIGQFNPQRRTAKSPSTANDATHFGRERCACECSTSEALWFQKRIAKHAWENWSLAAITLARQGSKRNYSALPASSERCVASCAMLAGAKIRELTVGRVGSLRKCCMLCVSCDVCILFVVFCVCIVACVRCAWVSGWCMLRWWSWWCDCVLCVRCCVCCVCCVCVESRVVYVVRVFKVSRENTPITYCKTTKTNHNIPQQDENIPLNKTKNANTTPIPLPTNKITRKKDTTHHEQTTTYKYCPNVVCPCFSECHAKSRMCL